MNVLILGGTLFLGRHLVEAAQARGHEVTLFNRGQTNPDLFPEVEKLRGDRDTGDLSALGGRSWDAVVDTSARVPRWVREFAEAVGDRVGHYTFVSSISVYADTSEPGTDETAPVQVLVDEKVEISNAETYGALKALCERTAETLMSGRVLCVRPGLIIGPYDDSGRFAYWVHRIARGGDVLAPEPREQPVQLVDARDLADWILRMAEKREVGVLNATGPEHPLTMAQMLQKILFETGSGARLAWVDERSLVDAGVEAWSDLPLWLAPNVDPAHAGFLSIDTSKALAAGLVFRPLPDSIRDTLEHAETNPEAGLDRLRERELLPT